MKNILKLLILVALPTHAIGQVNYSDKDSLNNWEVGLDLLWLIDKNQVPSKSLFVRNNFTNGKNEKRAWRFRLGVDNNYYDSAQSNGILPHDININSIIVRSGLEWQRNLSTRYILFMALT